MEEGGEERELIWKSESAAANQSMVSLTVGRVMTTLLAARPKKLNDAVSRLSSSDHHLPRLSSLDSLDESLWFLHKYVKDAAQNVVALDEILVPMIEHWLRFKDWKRGGQVMVLLNWLFQDEILFRVIAENLAGIIVRKDDRYVLLGWCILVRSLIEYETAPSQFSLNGIRERYDDLLEKMSTCISRLSSILSKGSCLQDGFELPSRLSVSAADCLLALTNALTKKTHVQSSKSKVLKSSASSQPAALISTAASDQRVKVACKSSEVLDLDMKILLLNHMEELINLVRKLLSWSRKSWPLHAKGLEQVLRWLQEIKVHYSCSQDETDLKILKAGALLLSSCWKHYSMLLVLETHLFTRQYEEWLDQYLSGIKYYTENHTDENTDNKDSVETRKFFLNCLCLLLGRLDRKKIETTLSEHGMQIFQVLLSQFRCAADEDVVEEVVCMFKEFFFKPNVSSGNNPNDARQMDAMLPLLLQFLDERDLTSRAVVMLVAEYCSMNRDAQCLQEVLERFASGNVSQRRNVLDVISEIIRLMPASRDALPQLTWKDVANHLLDCLEDEEVVICEQASKLLPLIDPLLVLPPLVRLVCSSDKRMLISAGDALVGVLKYHNHNVEVIYMLLDCISDHSQSVGLSKVTGNIEEGSELQGDRVLKLIPEWSRSVGDWTSLIGPLIDKMFAEPSNATIVKFLNLISEHLIKTTDLVLSRILHHTKGQKEIDKSYKRDDFLEVQQSLFERLCPLLIIRMLSLGAFTDLKLSSMYGRLPNQVVVYDVNTADHDCVAALLLNRAFSKFEFEDVRKLAAELCGRLHPQVLFPFISSILEEAASSHDTLKIKAGLFSVCTSLVVRGRESISQLVKFEIIKTLEMVLHWPSLDGDEVSKAQHGCIDCLALMICAELQAPDSYQTGDSILKKTFLDYVMDQFIHGKNDELNLISFPFRLCMANVLISACQKITDSCRKPFSRKALPPLLQSVEKIKESEIKSACIQVLFSAVYHLKSAVLPYSSQLLNISLKFLKTGSDKERMASAKLMASLLASEDEILECISENILEVRSLLSSISSSDPSSELRQVCRKMLGCLTSSQ